MRLHESATNNHLDEDEDEDGECIYEGNDRENDDHVSEDEFNDIDVPEDEDTEEEDEHEELDDDWRNSQYGGEKGHGGGNVEIGIERDDEKPRLSDVSSEHKNVNDSDDSDTNEGNTNECGNYDEGEVDEDAQETDNENDSDGDGALCDGERPSDSECDDGSSVHSEDLEYFEGEQVFEAETYAVPDHVDETHTTIGTNQDDDFESFKDLASLTEYVDNNSWVHEVGYC